MSLRGARGGTGVSPVHNGQDARPTGNLFFHALRLLRCARNDISRENGCPARLNGYAIPPFIVDYIARFWYARHHVSPITKVWLTQGGIVKALVTSVLLLFSFVSIGHPQESFTAFSSTIGYGRPDPAKWNLARNGMDDKSKAYLLMFEHTPIKGAQGRNIRPVIAIICESVPDALDVIQYSISKRAHTPFEVNKLITYQDGSFVYRNSVGYEGTYKRGGVEHKVLVAHMRHGSVGLQVICDSTDGVYDQVEGDMRSFLRSITFKE